MLYYDQLLPLCIFFIRWLLVNLIHLQLLCVYIKTLYEFSWSSFARIVGFISVLTYLAFAWLAGWKIYSQRGHWKRLVLKPCLHIRKVHVKQKGHPASLMKYWSISIEILWNHWKHIFCIYSTDGSCL